MKKIAFVFGGLNIIVAILAINVLLSFWTSLRFDVTNSKVHSLSPSTKEYIKKLEDIVQIKVYLTEDIPPELKNIKSGLKTILKDIGSQNNKIKITYMDPSNSEEIKNEATKLGIEPVQFSKIKSDKFEVVNGYFGLAMFYGDKKEVLPVAGDVGNLEYFLLSGIKKLVNKQLPTVAISEEKKDTQSKIEILKKMIGQNYNIVETELKDGFKLPQNASSLVIVGNKKVLNEGGLTELRSWIKDGKGIISFIDKFEVSNVLYGMKNVDTGLEKIYQEHGIIVENKTVADESNSIASFRTQAGSIMVKYPYWLQILPENVNRQLPVMSGINSLNLFWPSPIKIEKKADWLFKSSKKSMAKDGSDFSLEKQITIDPMDNGEYVLGAVNTDGVKLAMITDSEMIKDDFIVNNQQNAILAVNLVDYFSQDQSLLKIRSKNINVNPISEISNNQKSIIKIVNMLLPLIIIGFSVLISNFIRKSNNS